MTILAGVAAAGLAAAADFPVSEISNGKITAKFYLPDPKAGYYQGTRFDWSGVIYSLQANGHEYFGQWFDKYDPKIHDAIAGPVEEFVQGNTSVGYDEVQPGGTFVRLGIGAVRKREEKAFNRFTTYDIVDPGKWSTRPAKDHIEFLQELGDTNGYAYRYTKVVRLLKGKNEMVIEHSLTNTGKKKIETSQYNHNFFTLDHQPTGPGSSVKFAFTPKAKQPLDPTYAEVRGDTLVYLKELPKGVSVFTEFEGFGPKASDYDIRVESSAAGAGVRITGDRPISKVIYWSITTTFCPEAYIDLSVEPGKTTKWTYRYEFYPVEKK